MIKGADTKPIMASAPYVVEDEFYTQRQPHMPIEPDVGLAYMKDDGVLYIYTKSTSLHMHHMMIQSGIGTARGQAGPREPAGGGRHVRLQAEPHLGGPSRGCLHGHGQAGLSQIRLLPAADLYGKALPLLHQAEDGRRQGRQAAGHGGRLDGRSRTVRRIRGWRSP